jgi:hypothetical protein
VGFAALHPPTEARISAGSVLIEKFEGEFLVVPQFETGSGPHPRPDDAVNRRKQAVLFCKKEPKNSFL